MFKSKIKTDGSVSSRHKNVAVRLLGSDPRLAHTPVCCGLSSPSLGGAYIITWLYIAPGEDWRAVASEMIPRLLREFIKTKNRQGLKGFEFVVASHHVDQNDTRHLRVGCSIKRCSEMASRISASVAPFSSEDAFVSIYDS